MLRQFHTRDAMLSSLGTLVAGRFDDDPKEILDHLEQIGWHFEGDIGITFPVVDREPMLAVTDADCAELPEPICRALKPNLETMLRAAANGDLCIMECQLKSTGETVAAICAASRDEDEVTMTPFGVMLCGNTYEMLTPPEECQQ